MGVLLSRVLVFCVGGLVVGVGCGGSGDAGGGGSNGGGNAGNADASASDGSGGAAGASAAAGTGGIGGGAGASGAGAGGSGADGGVCPAQQPLQGSSCSPQGLSCPYERGACCRTIANCESGKWTVDFTGCTGCPNDAPIAGGVCDPCWVGPTCTYSRCSDPSGGIISATCRDDLKTWEVKTDACTDFQCGSKQCTANQLCVQPGYTCVDNPCQNQPLSCACAGPAVCPGVGYECRHMSGRMFSCNCLTC